MEIKELCNNGEERRGEEGGRGRKEDGVMTARAPRGSSPFCSATIPPQLAFPPRRDLVHIYAGGMAPLN